ncbi:MAG: hypothetical protein LBD11_04790 [Candidatus Peribacteria bacterium]|nr:hypothetical protein [Candidatus Peribacteria bacterium]
MTYVVEGDPVISNNSFTGSYSTGIVLTYTGYKTVDCLQVADTGTITITVFPLPSIENVNLNGYVNDPFSTALTGQNLTGTLTWYVSGTALSGNSYTGNYPATAGTTTVKYKVCLDVTGLPQQCSDEATITIKSNIRGGGGGGSSIVRDVCPNEDTSGSYYDGKCSVDTDETETVLSGDVAEVIEQPVSTAKCSIEGSKYDDETNAAYLYACENDITTQRTIQDARLDDLLTRAENAKLISNYAMIVLGKTPDTTKDCSNFYDSIQSYKNTDLYDAMITSCQLDIMGINPDKTPIPDFMGAYPLERRDFGTVFSRLLRGNVNEYKGEKYWDGHLQALKDAEIITNLNRSMNEYRSRIFLQIYRSTQK